MSSRLNLVLLVLASAGSAMADPCGMVPPIYQGQGSPITRVGEQTTYVFYKDGVETFVIRPGFQGKVDEFGMLIPFPTPPALRKVPDQIFQHVASAIDPPEINVDLRLVKYQLNALKKTSQSASISFQGGKLADNEVKVLKKEAVGMYEVVVLAAGSADALNKWMTDHGYKYPDGMDDVCEEYVQAKWCFVAVKTKVGQKDGADPKPGQRRVKTKLPQGSSFDGHVQGMGFRFKTDQLVVPMRLSAFNDGELRNIVYLMTDGPKKIRSIPEEYVVRQISGRQLFNNVTEPLPLRITGGTERDLRTRIKNNDHFMLRPPRQFGATPVINWNLKPAERLRQARDPRPYNAAAKELFAADLLAIHNDDLTLPHEEQEKELLRIGERFGLRGAEIDKQHAKALQAEAEKIVADGLKDLKNMTLT
ncbi:MAG: DUF2330 domain-containing protein, partial [Planctomycetales bacterium]